MQDVELVTINPSTRLVRSRTRLTGLSNESEADPTLGGSFIGDYIEVTSLRGAVYLGYNANFRSIPFLGEGTPIPQQDNFLARRRF